MAKRHKRNGEGISFSDAISALSNWYHQEVSEWADDFDKRIKEGEWEDAESFREEFDQATDGAQIIIYTQQAKAVLLVSKNDEAYEEEFGEKADTVEAAALIAFQHDILERMEEDPNDDDTFAEEDEDEDDDE